MLDLQLGGDFTDRGCSICDACQNPRQAGVGPEIAVSYVAGTRLGMEYAVGEERLIERKGKKKVLISDKWVPCFGKVYW